MINDLACQRPHFSSAFSSAFSLPFPSCFEDSTKLSGVVGPNLCTVDELGPTPTGNLVESSKQDGNGNENADENADEK